MSSSSLAALMQGEQWLVGAPARAAQRASRGCFRRHKSNDQRHAALSARRRCHPPFRALCRTTSPPRARSFPPGKIKIGQTSRGSDEGERVILRQGKELEQGQTKAAQSEHRAKTQFKPGTALHRVASSDRTDLGGLCRDQGRPSNPGARLRFVPKPATYGNSKRHDFADHVLNA